MLSPNKRKNIDAPNSVTLDGFWYKYSQTTDQRTKIIDLFILYLLVLITIQLFYRLVVGDDFPRNAFVAGTFCPAGIIVLLIILRNKGRDYRQIGEFFVASMVLFVASINFAG